MGSLNSEAGILSTTNTWLLYIEYVYDIYKLNDSIYVRLGSMSTSSKMTALMAKVKKTKSWVKVEGE